MVFNGTFNPYKFCERVPQILIRRYYVDVLVQDICHLFLGDIVLVLDQENLCLYWSILSVFGSFVIVGKCVGEGLWV